MHTLKKFIFPFIGFFIFATVAAAPSEKQANSSPWTDPEVIKAAIAIDMSEEQAALFRTAMGTFIDGVWKDSMNLIKRQKPNLEKELKRVTRKHRKKLDQKMRAVFTEDQQFSRYQAYRDLLLSKLKKQVSSGSFWISCDLWNSFNSILLPKLTETAQLRTGQQSACQVPRPRSPI